MGLALRFSPLLNRQAIHNDATKRRCHKAGRSMGCIKVNLERRQLSDGFECLTFLGLQPTTGKGRTGGRGGMLRTATARFGHLRGQKK